MQIRRRIQTAAPESNFDSTLERELLSAQRELATLLNGGLTFADNFKCDTVVVADTGVANAEFAVPHSLKKIPIGYLVIRRDKAGVVFDSTTSWTIADIYLKCSVANTNITVIIF